MINQIKFYMIYILNMDNKNIEVLSYTYINTNNTYKNLYKNFVTISNFVPHPYHMVSPSP
jgi:hypothetical protein